MPHWKKRETVFAEYGIQLTMPGPWQARPSDDPLRWMYRSGDHKEQLIISMREMEEARKQSEAVGLMQRAVARHRRAVELGLQRVPDVTMSDVELAERSGIPSGSYQGVGSEHQFWSTLLFPKGTVWALFYDAFRLSPEDAEAHAQAIFDSVRFSEAFS